MPYIVTFRDGFVDQLMQLPRNLLGRIDHISQELREDPCRFGGNIKKLRGFQYLWRYRIGDYRIIYGVIENQVQYLAAGPRRDVYERFHYDPDNIDEALLAGFEAELFPASDAARQFRESREWEKFAERQERIRQQALEQSDHRKNLPLPYSITPEMLTAWQVPPGYHEPLIACRTESELLEANVPTDIIDMLVDRLFAGPVEKIIDQPVRVLLSDDEFSLYVEGQITEFLLKLDEDQERLVDWALDGPTMVKGGPGSGKSTVAMYRARAIMDRAKALNQAPPSILFTTYTNALVKASEELLGRLLANLSGQCHVSTLDRIAVQFLSKEEQEQSFVGWHSPKVKDLFRATRTKFKPDVGNSLENALVSKKLCSLGDDYLLDEFNWVIEGNGIDTLEAYLSADRTGRGEGLTQRDRRAIWSLYQQVTKQLKRNKLLTWDKIRQHALELTRKKGGIYDYVIIDEAQDLTPVAIRLCVELAKDAKGIFLTADHSQSIYNRGFSYSKVHDQLKTARRTRHLKRNHRSTHEIMQAARQIVAGTGAVDEENLAQICMHFGPKPVLALVADDNSHIQVVIDYIYRQSRLLGLPPGAAAILCPTNNLAEEIADRCTAKGLPAQYMPGDKLQLDIPEVKVMTMHAAKGLEFPIVAVPYVNRDILPRSLSIDSSDDPIQHEQHERRLFFVATTRSMRRLIVTSSEGYQSAFFDNLTTEYWDVQSRG